MSQSAEMTVDAVLDATGLNCPEPVMMLHNKVRDLAGGAMLKVIATDPSTQRDIPKFCVFLRRSAPLRVRDPARRLAYSAAATCESASARRSSRRRSGRSAPPAPT